MSTKVPTASVQIQKKLVGRLSPDLVALAAKDNTFAWHADKKTKILTLDSKGSQGINRLKVWGSNDRARSGYIGLGSALEELGFDNPEELIGDTFDAEVVGDKIEISFLE